MFWESSLTVVRHICRFIFSLNLVQQLKQSIHMLLNDLFLFIQGILGQSWCLDDA